MFKIILYQKRSIGKQLVSLFEDCSPPITGEVEGVIAGYVTENKGRRCDQESALDIK